MIYEITGQPGHGKTLYGLFLARKFSREGREIYAHGIKDLAYEKLGWHRLEDPTRWADLPDNSVIVIDECYSVFPNRNAASAVPSYIEALARHRHRGLDFILIHQQPNQVDPFVRGLVEQHIHVRRKFGFGAAVLKTWDYSTPNPIKDNPLRSPGWKYDKSLYELYTSATMHTVKKSIPWQFVIAAPVALYVCYVGYRLISGHLVDTGSKAQAPVAASPSGGVAAGVTSYHGARPPIASAEDFIRQFSPRIPAIPGSAPVFDQRQVQSMPQVTCASSGPGLDGNGKHTPGGCHCITEQGTPWDVGGHGQCQVLAKIGKPYDYFRNPNQARQAGQDGASGPGVQGDPPADTGAAPSAAPAVGSSASSTVLVAPYGGMGYGPNAAP